MKTVLKSNIKFHRILTISVILIVLMGFKCSSNNNLLYSAGESNRLILVLNKDNTFSLTKNLGISGIFLTRGKWENINDTLFLESQFKSINDSVLTEEQYLPSLGNNVRFNFSSYYPVDMLNERGFSLTLLELSINGKIVDPLPPKDDFNLKIDSKIDSISFFLAGDDYASAYVTYYPKKENTNYFHFQYFFTSSPFYINEMILVGNRNKLKVLSVNGRSYGIDYYYYRRK